MYTRCNGRCKFCKRETLRGGGEGKGGDEGWETFGWGSIPKDMGIVTCPSPFSMQNINNYLPGGHLGERHLGKTWGLGFRKTSNNACCCKSVHVHISWRRVFGEKRPDRVCSIMAWTRTIYLLGPRDSGLPGTCLLQKPFQIVIEANTRIACVDIITDAHTNSGRDNSPQVLFARNQSFAGNRYVATRIHELRDFRLTPHLLGFKFSVSTGNQRFSFRVM